MENLAEWQLFGASNLPHASNFAPRSQSSRRLEKPIRSRRLGELAIIGYLWSEIDQGRQPPFSPCSVGLFRTFCVPNEKANSRLVTGVDFAGHSLLPGHEVLQALKVHLLHRLRGRPVQLPGDVIPLRVGVDSELDRSVEFGSIGGLIDFAWLSG